MDLNFTLKELIHSDIAEKNKIFNMPSIDEFDNLMLLIIKVLQPIRDYFKAPVIISSGYRNKRINKLVKGSPTSEHILGNAADFIVKGKTVQEVYDWIKKSDLRYTELIQENGKWIHIAYNKNYLIRENLIYKNGKYIIDNA